MNFIKHIESRFQECVLLLTLALSTWTTLGALHFLFSGSNPVSSFLYFGQLGQKFIGQSFHLLGLVYFSIPLGIFLLGAYIIKKCQRGNELFFLWKTLLARFIAFSFLTLCLCALTHIVGIHLQFNDHSLEKLGGLLGFKLGGFLYAKVGLSGSLISLFTSVCFVGILSYKLSLSDAFLSSTDCLKNFSLKLFKLSQLTCIYILRFADSRLMNFRVYYHLKKHKKESLLQQHSVQLTEQSSLEEAVNAPSIARNEAPPASQTKTRKKAKLRVAIDNTQEIKLDSLKEQNTTLTEENPKSSEPTEKNEEKFSVHIKPWKKTYSTPSKKILKKGKAAQSFTKKENDEQSTLLKSCLEGFGLKGKVVAVHRGVRLSMFEFEPGPGVKISKIQALTNDLALSLGAPSIRILAPIPGKSTVGIEIPNQDFPVLQLGDLVNEAQKSDKAVLPFPLGKNVYGEVVVEDLNTMPHLLVSGTTGSGKSVFTNCLISSLLYNKSPKDLRFIMIDPKMIELTPYNGIPHLLKPVISDVEESKEALIWAEEEMDKRYKIFSDVGARSIDTYNKKIKTLSKKSLERKLGKKLDHSLEHMPYIVIVIDELADLMITQGKEVEKPITRIAQKARACGIHLVLATQRPSSEIVTGLIKTNFPSRIAFKVSSSVDSRTILDTSGAEKLLGHGDMLYMPNGKNISRVQGAFISEEEVSKVVRCIED